MRRVSTVAQFSWSLQLMCCGVNSYTQWSTVLPSSSYPGSCCTDLINCYSNTASRSVYTEVLIYTLTYVCWPGIWAPIIIIIIDCTYLIGYNYCAHRVVLTVWWNMKTYNWMWWAPLHWHLGFFRWVYNTVLIVLSFHKRTHTHTHTTLTHTPHTHTTHHSHTTHTHTDCWASH